MNAALASGRHAAKAIFQQDATPELAPKGGFSGG